MAFDALATAANLGVLTTPPTDIVNAYVCPSRSIGKGNSRDLSPSVTLFFHTILLAVSAVGRLWCYGSLGEQFRFEVHIQEKHRLITYGPYAYVRHPSYFILYGTYIGSLGVLVAKGTWMRECFLQVPGATLLSVIGGEQGFGALLKLSVAEYVMLSFVGAWVVAVLSCERNMAARSLTEDQALKNEFGKEWVDYARRVRWRMFPLVY